MTHHRNTSAVQAARRGWHGGFPRRSLLSGAVACMALALLASTAAAQEELDESSGSLFPQADYTELGLDIPANETPKPGKGRRVIVPDLQDEPVVAEIYLEYNDTLITLLPNGYLKSVPKSKATATERPFEPLSSEGMVAELKEKFPGFKTATTERHVFVYNCSEPFRAGASGIINSMYRKLLLYCQGINKEAEEPRIPLVVVLFRTEEEFQKYRAMPQGVAAYYNTVSNQVLIYEQSNLTKVAPEIAFKESVSTIAHESVHQMLHNVGVQQRLSRWPAWISEGLPEFFAPTQVGKRARWKGIGQPHDLRMYELSRAMKAAGVPKINIRESIEAEQLNSLGYARSWALVHYLAANDRGRFFELLRDVSQLAPGEDRPEAGKYFKKHFGDNYDEFDQKLLIHLQKTPYRDPIASQTHYVVIARSRAGERAVMSFSLAVLNKWREQVLTVDPRTQFKIQPFPSRGAAEAFLDRWAR